MSQRWGRAARAAARLCLALSASFAGAPCAIAQGADTTPPTVTNRVPADKALLKYGGAPVISATLADPDGTGVVPSTLVFLVDGVDVTAKAVFNGSQVSYTPTTTLSEGKHRVELGVSDAAGNGMLSVWEFTTWTVPRMTSSTPANNGWLNGNGPMLVTLFLADEGSGLDVARGGRLSVDSTNDVSAGVTMLADRMTYTFPSGSRQGLFSLMANFYDKAGYVGAAFLNVSIDSLKPTISNESPRDTQIATAYPEIYVKFVDPRTNAQPSNIDQASLRLYLDGQDVTSKVVRSGSGNGPFSISYRPTTSMPVAPGPHTVRFVVADNAGNVAESNWGFTTPGASAPPEVVLTAPANGAVLPADWSPKLEGTFRDAGGGVDLASLRIELDGVDVTNKASATASGFMLVWPVPLSEGSHLLSVGVADSSGARTTKTVAFKTQSAPVIGGESPKDTFLAPGAAALVRATYSDVGSGVDTAGIKLFFNDVDVTARAAVGPEGISYTVPQPLADATYRVRLVVPDKAGLVTTSEWSFSRGQPPVIIGMQPQGVLPPGSRPTISAQFSDAQQGIDTSTVLLIVNDVDVTAQAAVTATGISYTPAQPLPAGNYSIYLEVRNRTNAVGSQAWGFDVAEPVRYTLEFLTGPQTVLEPRLKLELRAGASNADGTSLPRLTLRGRELAHVRVDSENLDVYEGEVDLIDGVNTLEVEATFPDGVVRRESLEVSYDAPLQLTITSPADKAMLGRAIATSPGDLTGNVERPVAITGRMSKPAVSVIINQQSAVLSAGGREFTFPNFFLREGTNMITAVATDQRGRTSSSAITVSVDQTAPILSIESPLNAAVTSQAAVDVRGMVNDAVEGLTGAPEPLVTVRVNGAVPQGLKPAQVADRYFLLADVPLSIGENVLQVTATDQFGNARMQETRISRVAVGADRLAAAGGNHQQGPIGTELPRPFVVTALSAGGSPLANMPVVFDIVRGTGSISLVQGAPTRPDGVNTARNLVVNTDEFGIAKVWLTLGKLSGPGANVVQARHPSLGEAVTFIATGERGAVAKVSADLGINQFAQTGMQPLELMSVLVRDAEDNPLPGVQVVYRVEEGDAFFADTPGAPAGDNGRRLILTTDKNGYVAARPWIGQKPGQVRISAGAVALAGGNPDDEAALFGSVSFYVQAKQAVDGPASFKGFVYTDKGLPLAGVRVSIGRTSLSSTTDDAGAFELQDAPPGRVDLFIDGRTVNPTNDPAKQQWPSLHFEAYVVNGQQNELPHPIFLPPLMVSEAKVVGGPEDVILKIPGIEGFQMKVKANSVTFPDGSRTGTMVVSPVAADKLPMAPPAGGAVFGLPAWTIQPAGARFDPPIEVMMPNNTAKPPGDNIPIVQWDHDLGQYVPMGRATVSEDGSVFITDLGSGITKAGWGGPCIYDPVKCVTPAPPTCKSCQKVSQKPCQGGTCVPDSAADLQPCGDNQCSACKGGTCTRLPQMDDTRLSVAQGQVAFDLTVNGKIRWLGRKLGLVWESKGSIALGYSRERVCCVAGADGTEGKYEVSGGGTAEVMAALPIVLVAKLWGFFEDRPTPTGPSFVVKLNGALAGAANYDACKNQGDVQLKGSIGADVGFSAWGADFKFDYLNHGGTVTKSRGELRPLDIGFLGTIELAATRAQRNAIRYATTSNLVFYARSQVSFATLNWALFDIQIPISSNSIDEDIIEIPGL